MMDEAVPCPFCGRHDVEIVHNTIDEYYVRCRTCSATGPKAANEKGALDWWKTRTWGDNKRRLSMAIVMLQKSKVGDRLPGDIVETFEDDKFFPPNIYETFDMMPIPGFTKAELEVELGKKRPEIRPAWKSKTVEWTLEEPEKKELWQNDQDEWLFLEERPRFLVTFNGMKPADRTSLESEEVDVEVKRILIADNTKECITRFEENFNKVDNLIVSIGE